MLEKYQKRNTDWKSNLGNMVHTIWNDLYKVWIYKRIIHTGMNAYIGTKSTKLCMECTCIL